ncbi:helix-turn-helix domain-containing protein [Neisseria sp. HMSC31F04]|uniref:helix-turn-helix domain-containing protein n=1 Tax=Neisseria sp. HMSC31F04 TaxID=1581075 RepID=UPI0009F5B399|nr:helix-turn-helix domain-containing protein [Neisseria sp. HMSC31F04]
MIGNRIKLARKQRGRSQKWLADEVGVHQTGVAQWETGRTDPATENLSRIAQALDVNFEWLATGKGEMTGIVYEPASVVLTEALPEYNSYTEEQREFLRLFDALPKGKRETLLTFMRDWINLK